MTPTPLSIARASDRLCWPGRLIGALGVAPTDGLADVLDLARVPEG